MGNYSKDVDGTIQECTTTGSFADHDIEDGATLIERTYYRLAEAGMDDFRASETHFDALESAFIWAYLRTTDETGIPPHVEAAIDDAKAFTATEFSDRPDADCRTEVVPAFYRYAAGFHCSYRE